MKLLLVIVCLLPFVSNAQNLTGVWRGKFAQSFFGSFTGDEYKFEVQIDHRSLQARGVTYSYHNTEFYAKAGMKGTWDKANKRYILEELEIIEVRKMSGVDACRMTCILTYSKSGTEEYLTGTYTSINIRDNSSCGGGTVRLKKMETSVFKKEPFLVKRENEIKQRQIAKNNAQRTNSNTVAKNNTLPKRNVVTPKTTTIATKLPSTTNKKPDVVKNNPVVKNTPTITAPPEIKTTKVETPAPPPVVRNRKNDIIESIPLDAENIKIDFYDNGEIDGDSISVYLNGKMLLQKQRLSYDPITIKLKKSELNDVNDIVMVADNLGSIPPNTSTMIVYVGAKRYEVRMESNTQKNAAVRFEK